MIHIPASQRLKQMRCCMETTAVAVACTCRAATRPLTAKSRHSQLPQQTGERGVALVVALILLVVLALVGMAAVRGTIMQQKMASNFTDRLVAFQADEAALRQAQIVAQALPTPISAAALPATIRDCSPASGNTCLANPLTDTNLPAANIKPVLTTSFDAGSLSAAQPQYVIDYMGNFNAPTPTVQQLSGCSGYAPCGLVNKADYYRITVRSGPAGALDRATVTMQSMFRR